MVQNYHNRPPSLARTIICSVWLQITDVLVLAEFSRRHNSVESRCVCPLRLAKKPNSLSSKALNMSTKYLAVGYNHFLFTSLRRVANFLQSLTPSRDGGYQRVQLTLWHHFKFRHCSFSWVLLWILTKLEAVYKLSNNGGRGDCMGVLRDHCSCAMNSLPCPVEFEFDFWQLCIFDGAMTMRCYAKILKRCSLMFLLPWFLLF